MKEADVILLRTDKPSTFPINDPIGAVAWGMDTSTVDSVFVADKALRTASICFAGAEAPCSVS